MMMKMKLFWSRWLLSWRACWRMRLATGNLMRPALAGGQAMFKGVAASPGMAMGEAVVITPPADLNSVPDLVPSDQDYEVARLKEAIGKTRSEIRAAAERLASRISVSRISAI